MKVVIIALTAVEIFLICMLGLHAALTLPHVTDGVLQIQLDGLVAGALCIFFVVNRIRDWRDR